MNLHFRLMNRRDLQTLISSSKLTKIQHNIAMKKNAPRGKNQFTVFSTINIPQNISNDLEVPHNLLGQRVLFWPFVYSITCQQKQ